MAGYSVTFSVIDNATKQIDAINKRIAQTRAPIERMSKSISRFLDVSGLSKIASGFGSIARAAGMALRSLTPIVPVLGALTSGATIAGMMKLVNTFTQWGATLQTNASQIGINSDELQKMMDATTRAGGSAQDMVDTLKNLKEISAGAFTGQNTEALAMFQRLGISVRDANGHLKTAQELLPEVMKALDGLKDPADRARVAATLLGDSQNKLWEAFRQSGKPMEYWIELSERHLRLTDQQLQSLNNMRLAQASLGQSITTLGQQISATLADHFEPFVKALDDWITQNTPDILAKVGELSDAFKQWMQGVDWGQVKDDINGVVQLLKTMLEVVQAIAKAVEKTMFMFGLVNRKFTKQDVLTNSPFYAALSDEQKKMVQQQLGLSSEDVQKGREGGGTSFLQHPLGWLGNRLFRGGQGNAGAGDAVSPGATGSLKDALGVNEEQYDMFRGAVSKIESGGKYDIMGGSSGRFAGKYQMGQAEIAETAARLGEQTPSREAFLKDPAMQERYFENYTLDHHRQLMNDPKYAAMTPQQQMEVLGYAHNQGVGGARRYLATGQVGRDAFGTGGDAYSKAVRTALQSAPPATAPTAAPNGSVNVDITHRNAPPDSTVTAQGKGSVNVAPVRVEHPQVSFETT